MTDAAAPDARRHRDEPAHLRGLVAQTGLAQSEVAARLGVDLRTFQRYVNGESRIPYVVQFAVECIVREVYSSTVTRADMRAWPASRLAAELREHTKTVASLPPASLAYHRATGFVRLLERETKRRNGKAAP